MKIEWNSDQVDTIVKALEAVDKKSYDPIYGNLVERIELKDIEGYAEAVVVLEEFEVFTVIEAVNEIKDDQESYLRTGDLVDEDVVQMGFIVDQLGTKYGLTL
jgi:hypothetical protein